MNADEHAVLLAAAALYLLSALFCHGRWPLRGDRAGRWAIAAAVAGCGLHAVAIALCVLAARHWVLTELRATLLLVGWAIPATYLVVLRRAPIGLGAIAMALAAAAVVGALAVPAQPLEQTVDHPWFFFVHVIAAVAGYAAFSMAFCCSVAYLVQEALLKRKRLVGFSQRLPSLEAADAMGARLAALGFVLWTVMIATGALLAWLEVGEWWSWTPKQTWSLVTWTAYAAYTHLRTIGDYRGRRTVLILAVGFVCAGLTYLLAGYLGDPHHPFHSS